MAPIIFFQLLFIQRHLLLGRGRFRRGRAWFLLSRLRLAGASDWHPLLRCRCRLLRRFWVAHRLDSTRTGSDPKPFSQDAWRSPQIRRKPEVQTFKEATLAAACFSEFEPRNSFEFQAAAGRMTFRQFVP